MRYPAGSFQDAIVDLSRQLAHAQLQCDQAEKHKAGQHAALSEQQKSAVLAKCLVESEAELSRCQAELAQVKALLKQYAISFEKQPGVNQTEEDWNPDGENALRLSGMFEKGSDGEAIASDEWMSAEEALVDIKSNSDNDGFESTNELDDEITPSVSEGGDFDETVEANDPFGDNDLYDTYVNDEWLGRRSSCAFMFQDLDEKITVRKSKLRNLFRLRF